MWHMVKIKKKIEKIKWESRKGRCEGDNQELGNESGN